MTAQRLGGLAFWVLAGASIVGPWIYLTGDPNSPVAPLGYDLADFLFGPVWAVSLVAGVQVLGDQLAIYACRRSTLAMLASLLAAAAMVTVACIRSANRHYHLAHPDLHLEGSASVLVVWTTLIAGMSAAGWHFLGWTLLLIGSASWSSPLQPRPLSGLYLLSGTASLFVYLAPESEGLAGLLMVVVAAWQGIVLWRRSTGEPASSGASVLRSGSA